MWCSAFLFVYPKQQGKFCHHVHSNARLSMMVTIDFIRGWHELHGPRCVPAGDLDRPKFQPQIVIFILALSWETGVKHPTPEILQCPEDVMDSITPSSVNAPLTGQVTWNWLGPPEEIFQDRIQKFSLPPIPTQWLCSSLQQTLLRARYHGSL